MNFEIISIYIVIINLAGFFSMVIDKKRAINKKYRISEKNLFLIAILGGSLGSILGMNLIHHKTKHWYFKFGIPLILLLQIFILFYLFLK